MLGTVRGFFFIFSGIWLLNFQALSGQQTDNKTATGCSLTGSIISMSCEETQGVISVLSGISAHTTCQNDTMCCLLPTDCQHLLKESNLKTIQDDCDGLATCEWKIRTDYVSQGSCHIPLKINYEMLEYKCLATSTVPTQMTETTKFTSNMYMSSSEKTETTTTIKETKLKTGYVVAIVVACVVVVGVGIPLAVYVYRTFRSRQNMSTTSDGNAFSKDIAKTEQNDMDSSYEVRSIKSLNNSHIYLVPLEDKY